MKENEKSIGLRTVFMGTSTFADMILSALIEANYNLVAVYTQSNKKNARQQEPLKGAVKITAEKNRIPVIQPYRFDDGTISEFKNLKPDLLVVASYGKILPGKILEVPGFGAINVHPSLLPKFRGPSPIQNTLLSGEKETGTTIMLMDKGMDTGDILAQEKMPIGDNETYPEILEKLAVLSRELLLKTIPLWIERKIESKPQNNEEATLCQLIEREDGRIIWAAEAQAIFSQYRALIPWPGLYAFWERNELNMRLKFNKIGVIRQNPEILHQIGEVFQIGDRIGVQTSFGVITVEEVQLEGKNNTKIEDFLNGYPEFLGSILK